MTDKMRRAAKDAALLGICAAILFAQQVVFRALPNIELVSLLVIIFTLIFGKKVLFIIYVFVLLEGLIYGFSPWWWVPYLYVWTLLALTARLFRSQDSPLVWAVISGAFGLLFGALCAIPHLVVGGPAYALAYWISGIPFDLMHCASNFILCIVLWTPLLKLTRRCLRV